MQASSSRRVQILCATLKTYNCLKESLVFVSITKEKRKRNKTLKEREREKKRVRLCVFASALVSALRDDHDERE